MKIRSSLAIAVVGLLTLSPGAPAHQRPEPSARACGQVGFAPNSDDVAARIQARGLTCGLARDFVRDSNGRPGARFRGFRCKSTDVKNPQGLPYSRYRCTGADDVIRWRRY